MENDTVFEETQFVRERRTFEDGSDDADAAVAASAMRRIKFEGGRVKLYMDDALVFETPMANLLVENANRDIATVRQMTADFGALGAEGWAARHCKAANVEAGKN